MRVLFFGRLAQIAGSRERAAPDDLRTLSALVAHLTQSDPTLGEALAGKGVRAAVNKTIVTGDAPLNAGDEIAFMPPLSGG